MSTWYVRPISGEYGAEDGTTYDTAYDGFAGITWGVGGVVAGDTLYVCGTHTEALTVGDSGTDGNLITIRGDYTGDPGAINGSSLITTGLTINAEDYIQVLYLEVYNCKSASTPDSTESFGIDIVGSTGSRVAYCNLHDNYWNGVRLQGTTSCIIERNTIVDNNIRGIVAFASTATTIADTEIAYNTFTGNGRWGLSFDSNHSVDRNANATGLHVHHNTISGNGGGLTLEDVGHSVVELNTFGDNLLVDLDFGNTESGNAVNIGSAKDITVSRNAFNMTTDEAGDGNPGDVFNITTTVGGITTDNILITGNTVDVSPGADESAPVFISSLGSGVLTNGRVEGNRVVKTLGMYSRDNEWKVYNNTFAYCRYFSRFNIESMSSLEVKNNVFVQESGQSYPVSQGTLQLFSGDTPGLGGNVYLSNFGNVVAGYGGSNYTVAQLQAGPEPTALDTDPAFDADYNVTESTLLDTGVLAWGLGPRPAGIDGEPFSDQYISRGPKQQTTSCTHLAGISPGEYMTCKRDYWYTQGPRLMTWAYHNGAAINTAELRAPIINELAKFPVVALTSVDTGAAYEALRNELRAKNPKTKLLGHLNGVESYTPDSPGQRIIKAVGNNLDSSEVPDANFASTTLMLSGGANLPVMSAGQEFIVAQSASNNATYTVATSSAAVLTINETWTATGSESIYIIPGDTTYGLPSNSGGNYWYDPAGTILYIDSASGTKAYLDLSQTDAQDLLYNAMVGQYKEDAASWPQSTSGAYWDGLYIDQFIKVPNAPSLTLQGTGPDAAERAADVVGLQAVMRRFKERYPGALVVCNTNEDYYTANGELLEGRPDDISEAATFAGHSFPEMNVYMYKPATAATDAEIISGYELAQSVGAYYAYAPGPLYFTNTTPENIWPSVFTGLISGPWKDWCISQGITF